MRANQLLPVACAGLVMGVTASKPPGVNVYFGQVGMDGLASYCESGGFDTVTLAYVSASPETDPATNYPATNFGSRCDTGVYMVNNTASRLLANCTTLSQDIRHCQQLGKKVLLSTGGIWGQDAEHNYEVTTPENGEYFADFLWKAFGPCDPSWTGPRPFDTPSGSHTVVDGFDFDLEIHPTGQRGYISLLKRLRTYIDQYNGLVPESPIIITGASACPLVDGISEMNNLISNAVFDKLWVQFYGNSLCPAGSSEFNYDAWETFIANTTSKDALLYVGLPADHKVPGYMTAAKVNALADGLKGRPSFGGIMINEVAVAKAEANGGVPLYEAIYDHMLEGAQPLNSSRATTGSNVHFATKTESVTAQVTMTVHATGLPSGHVPGANSTQLGTGAGGRATATVFVTVPCASASRTVPDTSSGTRTNPTHSYSYSVTSAGQVWKANGKAWSLVAVAMLAAVLQVVSSLM